MAKNSVTALECLVTILYTCIGIVTISGQYRNSSHQGWGKHRVHKHIDALQRSELFVGFEKQEIEELFRCMRPRIRRFPKDAVVVSCGDDMHDIGFLLSGAMQICRRDSMGEVVSIRNLHAGGTIGLNHICAGIEKSSVNARALTESEMMFIEYREILYNYEDGTRLHAKILENISRDIARTNLDLAQKIEYMTIKSMRRRIYSYLLDEAAKAGSDEFVIPFDRTTLAAYLNVDRSALSRELSRMRKDGLLASIKTTLF